MNTISLYLNAIHETVNLKLYYRSDHCENLLGTYLYWTAMVRILSENKTSSK